MQLQKLVQFHKALADPNRIRILHLLSGGEMNGQTLADKLGVTPATVTHHAAKLREVGIVSERRDKNTIYFSLHDYMLRAHSSALLDFIYKGKEETDMESATEKNDKLRDAVLRNFFAKDGTLKQIPSQLKKKLIVLEYMVEQLEHGKKYAEKEINAFIQRFHPDFATIRREFIMHQYLYREQEIYEMNPREIWAKWETLS